MKFLDSLAQQFFIVPQPGEGPGGSPNNYGGNKSINRLEVTTDQCGAFDLDVFY